MFYVHQIYFKVAYEETFKEGRVWVVEKNVLGTNLGAGMVGTIGHFAFPRILVESNIL